MPGTKLSETDLILNSDGSAYHLHLREEHIADHVIVVGDQSRVEQISKHFDKLELKIQEPGVPYPYRPDRKGPYNCFINRNWDR